MSAWDHGLALLVGGVLPLLALLRARRGRPEEEDGEEYDTAAKVVFYWSNSVALWVLAGAALFVWTRAGRDTAELGLAPPSGGPTLPLLLTVLCVALLATDTWRQLHPARIERTRARWRRDTPFMPATPRELAHASVIVLSASICEEIVFRGFLISYLVALLGDAPAALAAAVLLPGLAFSLAHLYQGWAAAAKILVGAAILGALFLATGSLWIPMGLHFLTDALGSVYGLWLLGEERGTGDA